MRKLIAFFLFLAIALTASAGMTQSDEGTAGNAGSERKGNTTLPPVLKEEFRYYEVCGCCEKEIQCDLEKKCIGSGDGKKYDSMTNWKVKWDYGYSRGPNTCAADSFLVTVDITFQLPKWARTAEAPRALAEKWEQYERSLLVHEKRHEVLAMEAAVELTRSVGELPPARTCSEVDRNVQRVADERMRRLIAAQKTYDADTRHGATQGASFP